MSVDDFLKNPYRELEPLHFKGKLRGSRSDPFKISLGQNCSNLNQIFIRPSNSIPNQAQIIVRGHYYKTDCSLEYWDQGKPPCYSLSLDKQLWNHRIIHPTLCFCYALYTQFVSTLPFFFLENKLFFIKHFFLNNLIFLRLVATLKWNRKLSLNFSYLAWHEIKLFFRKF